jgi:hypothetical protein
MEDLVAAGLYDWPGATGPLDSEPMTPAQEKSHSEVLAPGTPVGDVTANVQPARLDIGGLLALSAPGKTGAVRWVAANGPSSVDVGMQADQDRGWGRSS